VFSGSLLVGGFVIFFIMSKAGQKLLQIQEKREEEKIGGV